MQIPDGYYDVFDGRFKLHFRNTRNALGMLKYDVANATIK